MIGMVWCEFSPLVQSAEPPPRTARPANAKVVTYSLAEDFSSTENRADGIWSYRLDDSDTEPGAFPLLTLASRDANALWGSDFPTPPIMWSEVAGYWGIGKNVTGRELISTRNGATWKPGEVLLHPKGAGSPSGLVIAWTAPAAMTIDAAYAFGMASRQGGGIGLRITMRIGGVDTGRRGLAEHRWRPRAIISQESPYPRVINCFSDAIATAIPTGDIIRADITITGRPGVSARPMAVQPVGGTVVEGGDFTFRVPAAGGRAIQWQKDGHPIAGATRADFRVKGVRMTDAGAYSVLVDSVPGGNAVLRVVPAEPLPERFPSPVPRELFSETLAEQEKELATSGQMLRFAASRRRLAADRYRPAYHFVSPESQLNDPNGLCFWQGRWHLFYQAYPPDEFPDPKDIAKRRQHWGHAVSDDLVHWRDLPYAIYPGVERMCFSGGTLVEETRVVAYYPGIDAGQMVAVSKDPLLLNWAKLGGRPVKSPVGDSCIWKEGETYFGLVGADGLVSSENLVDWTARGTLLEGNPFPLGDAGACPNFVPIGNKHLLLSFSHTLGGQYLLGDYDPRKHKLKPYAHGRFNHGRVSPGGVHAPSSAADGKGGVININNINDGRHSDDWDQIMSLPQRLSLEMDSQLRIEPVESVASLRTGHRHVGETRLPANRGDRARADQGKLDGTRGRDRPATFPDGAAQCPALPQFRGANVDHVLQLRPETEHLV